ncbi:peptidase [Bifidobacterium dolichotidis]|uniref:Peptidase n=1 Tax=Bifidobacterium dolichotidis TaxID=2306976 RepID=A0A430FRH8_9BIFI|nr:peptidase [Bifidobacterium dolichotidis]
MNVKQRSQAVFKRLQQQLVRFSTPDKRAAHAAPPPRHRKWSSIAACGAVLGMILVGVLPKAAYAEKQITQDFSMAMAGAILHDTYYMGRLATDEHNEAYYCREFANDADFIVISEAPAPDSVEARKMGWLLNKYARPERSITEEDRRNHGGIGWLVHDYFDFNDSNDHAWNRIRDTALDVYASSYERGQVLWNEAERNVPTHASIDVQYDEYKRRGHAIINVYNQFGMRPEEGNFAIQLRGPARVVGTSPEALQHAPLNTEVTVEWEATGDGPVSVDVVSNQYSIMFVESGQDFVRRGAQFADTIQTESFPVHGMIEPRLSTQAVEPVTQAGEVVQDDVALSVSKDAWQPWPEGFSLQAHGSYYDGLPKSAFTEVFAPADHESTQTYMDRIQAAGYTPVANADLTFTAPEQTQRATALTSDGKEYKTTENSAFGTWVWTISKAQQPEHVQEYLIEDFNSVFLEHQESNSTRRTVEVESEAAEHTGHIGTELMDVITVRGFPDDHGEFQGSEAMRVPADEPNAQVSVWWAGASTSGTASDSEDDQYRPDTAEVPQEDDHHKLIGTWDVPAVNGRIKFGGGSTDAHGNPVTVVAEYPGWYVFVWSFKGDGRAKPATSRYDDAWERVRIHKPVPDEQAPRISTQVSSAEVDINEPFSDAAHVEGKVPEGAYVTFVAYEAIQEGEEPGLNAVLFDSDHVAVDATVTDQIVHSKQTRSPTAGLVYWKATLWSQEGDVLATHDLGVESEIVKVREPESKPEPKPSPAAEAPKPQTPLARTGSATVVALMVSASLAVLAVLLLRVSRPQSRARHAASSQNNHISR